LLSNPVNTEDVKSPVVNDERDGRLEDEQIKADQIAREPTAAAGGGSVRVINAACRTADRAKIAV
jgi:hypothetical protein